MLTLTESQIRTLAGPEAVINAIREAFTRDYSRTLHMPVRTCVELGEGGVLLVMPAYDSAIGFAGVKLVTVTRATGVNAAYELIHGSSGALLARMEANWLTDVRTAATSSLATDLLARRDAATLGIFGTGRQAFAHLAVLPRVRGFQRFLVCGSGRAEADGFQDRVKREQGIDVQLVGPEACARESDVICTCTTSATPVFDGRWLRPGTHINAVGAFQPGTREVDDTTVRRSRVVVDTYDGALAEAGDLLIPLRSGAIAREHVAADLHEIASGTRPGRTGSDQITLFKSVGCALEDLVTAQLIWQRAMQ